MFVDDLDVDMVCYGRNSLGCNGLGLVFGRLFCWRFFVRRFGDFRDGVGVGIGVGIGSCVT